MHTESVKRQERRSLDTGVLRKVLVILMLEVMEGASQKINRGIDVLSSAVPGDRCEGGLG